MKSIFLTLISVVLVFCADSPYSLKKFQRVLDNSKLQATSSKYNPLYARHYGDFEDYQNRYFYLQDNKYMVFEMCKSKQRSELRRKKSWRVGEKKLKRLEAKIKLFPLDTKKEFTFLQIHGDSTKKPANYKPLLRLVWRRDYKGVKNHIWAVIRILKDGVYSTAKFDIGQRSRGFSKIIIEVAENKLNIWINNNHKILDYDLSYWKQYYNYFKAGVYLQSEGCARVLFSELKIKD